MVSKRKQNQIQNKQSNLMQPVKVLLVVVLVALSLGILANAMNKPLGRDEHMYCTAGAMLAQGKMIYRDFSYVAQLPYHPLLLAGLYKLFSTSHYLLVGRLLSAICDVLVMLCIVAVFRRAFGQYKICGMLFGLCSALLYVYNPVVDYANGYAWNNDVVVFCIVLSFLLYTRIEPQRKSRYWCSAGIGLLLTVATFMRMTTVLFEAIFFIMLLALPAENIKGRVRMILPFLGVAMVVSILPVWIVLQSLQAFKINAFRIHMLNSEWLKQIGMVFSKSQLAIALLTLPGYFMLFVVAIFLVFALAVVARKMRMPRGRNALLGVILAVVSFVMAFSLPTIWRQYLAPPATFLIISFAYPLAFLREAVETHKSKLNFILGAIAVSLATFVAVLFGPSVLERIRVLGNTGSWTPIQVHLISRDIAEKVKKPKLILTAAPLFAIEGGCEIYPEFSAGVFPYRIGNLLSEKARRITHIVGPDGIKDMVVKTPASAVIVGVEPRNFSFLEEPFRAVVGIDWETETYENGLTLYYKP